MLVGCIQEFRISGQVSYRVPWNTLPDLPQQPALYTDRHAGLGAWLGNRAPLRPVAQNARVPTWTGISDGVPSVFIQAPITDQPGLAATERATPVLVNFG